MYLIDTNVLSALRKRERNPEVARWMSEQRGVGVCGSVVAIGEIGRGLAAVEGRDPTFAAQIEDWLDALLRRYGDRILPVDPSVARRWGRLSRQAGNAGPDLVIAATALEHGLTVVTRNTRHFVPTGVPVVDPSTPMDADSRTRRQRARRRSSAGE